MTTFTYEQDGEIKRASGSFFRGEHTNFHPTNASFETPDFIAEYVMKGWAPAEKFVTKNTKIVAFGSCFAANISKYLDSRGFNVLTKKDGNDSYLTKMGDGIVNTAAILQQFEWAWQNKVPQAELWHGYRAEEFGYDERVRLATKALLDEVELFIITLGLSEVWYDEPTGEVFWRAVPKDAYNPTRHKFRVASHAETLAHLHKIHQLIRHYRPDANILFSLSPIPLAATFRRVSCLSADSVSKAILRSALDEFLRGHEDDARLHYMPSYEIVTRLFTNQWYTDRRHLNGHVLDFNMAMFEAFFCAGSSNNPHADFAKALEADRLIGRGGHEDEGMSYEELRRQSIEERHEEKREARRLGRMKERMNLKARAKAERVLNRAHSNARSRPAVLASIAIKAALAILAVQGAWTFLGPWISVANAAP